jgi:hypothetical protein
MVERWPSFRSGIRDKTGRVAAGNDIDGLASTMVLSQDEGDFAANRDPYNTCVASPAPAVQSEKKEFATSNDR